MTTIETDTEVVDECARIWAKYEIPLPATWRQSVRKWLDLGAEPDDLYRFIYVAGKNPNVAREDAFRYYAGCVWGALRDRTGSQS